MRRRNPQEYLYTPEYRFADLVVRLTHSPRSDIDTVMDGMTHGLDYGEYMYIGELRQLTPYWDELAELADICGGQIWDNYEGAVYYEKVGPSQTA
jgi:hypothetical protein